MRKDNIALLSLFLLTVMAFSLVPVKAFIYPDGSVDGLYEDFGPRLDRLQIIMYDGLDSMWTGLWNGEIDVTDWPLTVPWLITFTTPPADSHIQVTSYGGEAGMYLVDFNLNNNQYLGNPPGEPPGYPNPVVDITNNIQNPASNLHFRRGVNYLFNRTWYQDIIAGWGIMMYTPVPRYLGGWMPGEGLVHQDIRPGGALEALTYPNNEVDADAEFALAKMKIVAGQNGDKRFWDRDDDNICDAGEEIVINFNARQDTGQRKAAEWLTAQMETHGFVCNTDYLTGAQDYQETMLDKNYHIATLGWSNLGPDPDFLYDLYHVDNYWHSPSSACPNTQDLNDTITNYWAEAIKFNTTAEAARLSAWKFQERFATIVAQIPLYCADGYKAHSRAYVGAPGVSPEDQYEGDLWEGMCNQMGFGDNSWYSFENAHPQGHDFSSGDMTIRYGWSETDYPLHINPLYSESYWDREVLSKVYDTLGQRNPYALSTWESYLIENWTVGTWMDGEVEKSKVKITLRPDIKWSDGYAVTVDDAIYSLTQVAHDLVNNGYPPPWSWPTTQQVQSAKILDPYNVEILFAVKSFLSESWALGGFYIIPEHIWKPIVDSGDPTAFAPDPNVIGSGPWRYASMISGVTLWMVANKPGSVVTTDRPGAVAITSPGVFNYYPVDIQAYEQSYLAKFLPWSDLVFKVRLENMWTGTAMTVDKYVTIKRVNPPGNLNDTLVNITSNTLGLILAPGVPDYETFPVDSALAGKIEINVTIEYQTAPFIGLKRTVIVDPWITIKQDIASLRGNEVVSVPDFKVDGLDNNAVAHAFRTHPGDLRWNPGADIDGDYDVDMGDAYLIGVAYGWEAGDGIPPSTIPPQNIAVTDVQPLKTIVCQGYSIKINVTLQHQGEVDEDIELTVAFDSYNVSVSSFYIEGGTTTTITVLVANVAIPTGTYTIGVSAKTHFADPNLSDNTFNDDTVQVAISGDISEDGKVDGRDIAVIAKAMGTLAGQEGYVPNADINSDGKIDGRDIAIAAKWFGTHGP